MTLGATKPVHITIDPEFGRAHPLWSKNDNGTNIHSYPFSKALIERILRWTKYWDDNYVPFRQIDDTFTQGWTPEADVDGWIKEGIKITEKMIEEDPSVSIERKFLDYKDEN